ncbi:hypothetical protein J437_LFUL017938 [Ladona fulva]|uniref:Integrator complex subunit 12 n=1 Tax=Ladona fulva TaxID=123851 RepID=A0A8K0K601_LADFU|nr:hypothetical protein J437_LFUL017938 [Ladona fulva]
MDSSFHLNKMTAFELDPIFSLGLKLMHSKSRDSADQLRVILEEVTKQKYGGSSRLLPSMKRLAEERFDSKKSGSVEVSSKSSTKSATTVQQTAHHPVSSTVSSPVSPHSKTEEITASIETLGSSRVLGARHGSDGSDSDDADDLALEILEEDLMCVVCRGMDVGARNRLVECVECHSLYHQECHKPPIQEAHASDPRRVWTCSACTKPASHQPTAPVKPSTTVKVGGGKPISSMTTKKVEIKSPSSSTAPQASSKSGSSSSSSKSSYSSSSSKSGSSSSSTKASSSSKNAELNSSSKLSTLSSSSASSSGGGGSGSGSSSSSSSTSKASSSKIAHADKRIQIMKKKAAKLQEKRKLSK